MTEPLDIDMSSTGKIAIDIYSNFKVSDNESKWCYSSIEEVRQNVYNTGYPIEKFRFIIGNVENTNPENMPDKISLLRLDTDWYEFTKHSLTHLFPLLSEKGVKIIDDYGYWNGCTKAVDDYFIQNGINIFLHRIDNSGDRIGIKILK